MQSHGECRLSLHLVDWLDRLDDGMLHHQGSLISLVDGRHVAESLGDIVESGLQENIRASATTEVKC